MGIIGCIEDLGSRCAPVQSAPAHGGIFIACTMPMINENKLTNIITRCHQELDELFLLHQEAVILAELESAIELLGCFSELHQFHMDFENEQLIPMLAELGDPGRWPASLYSSEHDKVHELLQKTAGRLLPLRDDHLSSKAMRRGIIALLDEQKTLKGVCEHHQEREEIGLLPELDKLSDTEWRTSIITPFLEEWTQRMEHNMKIVNQLDLS